MGGKKQKKRKAAVKGKAKRAKAKVSAKASAPANGPVPASKNGPMIFIRMRSKTEMAEVKKVAKASGLSINTWCVEVLTKAAQA